MSKDIHPTKHAIEMMAARNVSWGDIVDIVEHPETTYGPDERGRKIVQRGNLSIVLGRDGAVVTVLLRQEEKWTDDHIRDRDRQPFTISHNQTNQTVMIHNSHRMQNSLGVEGLWCVHCSADAYHEDGRTKLYEPCKKSDVYMQDSQAFDIDNVIVYVHKSHEVRAVGNSIVCIKCDANGINELGRQALGKRCTNK